MIKWEYLTLKTYMQGLKKENIRRIHSKESQLKDLDQALKKEFPDNKVIFEQSSIDANIKYLDLLNFFGSLGWELISVDENTAFFKRPFS